MILRPATVGDVPGILVIWNAVICNTVQTFNPVEKCADDVQGAVAACAREARPFLVADTGEIAGFGTYGPFRGGAGYAHTVEHTLYIADDARGRGLGARMLGALEAHAREAGIHAMVGGIAAENEGSIRFHARHGFTEVGRMLEVGVKFGRYHDLVLVQKILS